MKKTCLICKKEYEVRPYRADISKYCSLKCFHHRNQKRENICKSCGTMFTNKKNPQRKYMFCSYICRAKYQSKKSRIIKECVNCKKIFSVIKYYSSQKCCSVDCANEYKDEGRTSIARRIRSSLAYEQWRKSVFERDNYTCQICECVGGKLNADHIKPFALYPDLRLEIDNGRTLCESCHRQTETFGNRINKLEFTGVEA